MFKSYSTPFALGLGVFLSVNGSAFAQSTQTDPATVIIPNSTSYYNQNGFTLPSQGYVSGQDVVKSVGGTTCQSAIGNGGPSLDIGMIGTNDLFNRDSLSVYGRVTVPLSKRPKRVDCTRLYDLEISRLKMELQLLRAGVMPGSGAANYMNGANASYAPPSEKRPDVRSEYEVEEVAQKPFVIGPMQ